MSALSKRAPQAERAGPEDRAENARARWATLEPPAPSGSPLPLHPGDVPQLSALAASAAAVAWRARIVLLGARGHTVTESAEALALSRQTVHLWRGRYLNHGLAALSRPAAANTAPTGLEHRIVRATLTDPPAPLGLTHWSSRTLGVELGVGRSTVCRAWAQWGLQPHGWRAVRLRTTPEVTVRVVEVVGLLVMREHRIQVLSIEPGGSPHPRSRAVPREGPRPERQGQSVLRAFAALRCASLAPGRGSVDVERFLDVCERAHRRYAGRGSRLLVLDGSSSPAASEQLSAWCEGRADVELVRSVSTEAWLRHVEVCVRVVEAPVAARGVVGCADELMAHLRGVLTGRTPLSGPLAWIDGTRPRSHTAPPARGPGPR